MPIFSCCFLCVLSMKKAPYERCFFHAIYGCGAVHTPEPRPQEKPPLWHAYCASIHASRTAQSSLICLRSVKPPKPMQTPQKRLPPEPRYPVQAAPCKALQCTVAVHANPCCAHHPGPCATGPNDSQQLALLAAQGCSLRSAEKAL